METKDKKNKRKRILDSLKNWEKEEKLKLITEIQESVKKAEIFERKTNFENYVGKLDEKSAEKMIRAINESRQPETRIIIDLD